MKTNTKLVLQVLLVLSWIIFVGVCIDAGGFLFNSLFDIFINPAAARHFWLGLDLSSLYNHDKGYFLIITLEMSLVAILRAILFYLIIKMLHDKKLDMSRPFNSDVKRFISRIAALCLFIGASSYTGVNYVHWLGSQGITMPDVDNLRLGGADVWMFMSVTLFVLAQIFKRGIEIQTENELTV